MSLFGPNILFDLDGTITDSAAGIMNSILYALDRLGRPPMDREALRRFIGPPLEESFRRFCGMDPKEAAKAMKEYRVYYQDKGIFENSLYEGIPELLQRLTDAGKTLLLATSKPEVFAVKILEHFEIGQYFTVKCGCELDGRRSNKAEVITEALRRGGITDPSTCVMVGDRIHDYDGATANHLVCIAAGYGYGSLEEMAPAAAYARSVAELGELLLHCGNRKGDCK